MQSTANPDSEQGSQFLSVGRHWHGLQSLRHLVIFGDSYSDVGFVTTGCPNPTERHPLGLPYPGITWAENDKPNWVGYFVKEFNKDRSLLVYDYAVGGDVVRNMVNRVDRLFIPKIGNRPDFAPWTPDDSLFITWIGINDCAFISGDDAIKACQQTLFELEVKLYALGARNFLFIDVPAIERAPGSESIRERTSQGFRKWNQHLREAINQFASSRTDVTTMLYSSYDLFTRMFTNPQAYGFTDEDIGKWGGAVWIDHIHPTTRVHREIAGDLFKFLESHSEGTTAFSE
ncbi:hypothetical protein K474DRAFT_1707544 [Panus rudis PR-1116 ss-1]|nr:hypothetical protein K474DRAFT_1707544 [Panus rudis PR-1116 ss-1]